MPSKKPYKVVRVPTKCSRCGGDGIWKGWYRGTCYRCGGKGIDPSATERKYVFDKGVSASEQKRLITENEDRLARNRDRARVRREEKKKAEFEANRDKNLAKVNKAHPGLLKKLAALKDSAAISMVHQAERKGSLSDAQVDYARKLIDRDKEQKARKRKRAAEQAAAAPVPADGKRQKFTGEILSTEWRDNGYTEVLKMLFKDDRGFKLWGTVPSAIGGEAKKGVRIEFFAKPERSDRDDKFGFYSRPTKAAVVRKGSANKFRWFRWRK